MTLASRVYFQSFFLPNINLKRNIAEMYVTLRAVKEDLPIVLNGQLLENGEIEIYFIAVPTRERYVRKINEEREVLIAQRNM
ncbi:hypothetical protein D3873_03100 [Paenisporosarcina cavernae]|uniref:Uncharacterized protein n=1 Tax=Paenisporosarcina cavernae TaxID=2320858 RepID=A0A385YQX8_9BACL|nr:hypothetical protein D3873_03100 [Paenisporosarcina cavernae]